MSAPGAIADHLQMVDRRLLVTQRGHLNSLWTVTIAIAGGTAPMPDKPSPGDATTFEMSHAGLRN